MRKTTIFCVVALLLVGLASAVAFAMPFGGFGKAIISGGNDRSPLGSGNAMPLRGFGNMFGSSDAIKEAVENGDYEKYMNALEESWQAFKSEITEEQFNEIAEHHKQTREMRESMEEQMEKIRQAMKNGDYSAWKEAIEGSPHGERLAEVVTGDNFDTYVRMHEAMKNREFESANELAKELGLEDKWPLSNPYRGFGMHSFR